MKTSFINIFDLRQPAFSRILFIVLTLFPGFHANANTQINISGPAGSGIFGSSVTVLSNGNVVVADPLYDATVAQTVIQDAGAVYLLEGKTGAIISVLTGARANDRVGSGVANANNGVFALPNGNYLVISPNWDNGTTANAGAVTFCSGVSGCGGAGISPDNSLVGTNTGDLTGNVTNGVRLLANGNYVLINPGWNGSRGAITWGNATTGVVGAISSSNSLVGSSGGDRVGTGSNGVLDVTELSNGNYVVISSSWSSNRGAVTLCRATGGCIGVVSSSNSMVGSGTSDSVGIGGVTKLSNGNFVVRHFLWDNGAVSNAGAVTFFDAVNAATGEVSAANSVVGSNPGDQVGNGNVEPLVNGSYVIKSPIWNNFRGAATFGNGTTGASGVVAETNSLLGSNSSDRVGEYVTALTNGNYVVRSPSWNSKGAVTWGSGVSGVSGFVSGANSLVGDVVSGGVGFNSVVALTNGNYVINSSAWATRGAVTWADGTIGITGTISGFNSLMGNLGDSVGNDGVYALPNGNYVVASSDWRNGNFIRAGAVTLCNGANGTSGFVSAENSLVGSHNDDSVGEGGIAVLPNSNYVIKSQRWNSSRGAATFVNSITGLTGEVSAANSLIGNTNDDQVGFGVTVLNSGNYIVQSPIWRNGSAFSAGALTFGNKSTGVSGTVSEANSLVGTNSSDNIGNGGLVQLPNGNFLVSSISWNGSRGAVTFGNGQTGVSGAISASNSLVGTKPGDGVSIGEAGITVLTNGNYVVGSPQWDRGDIADAGASTFCSGITGCNGEISALNSLVGTTAGDSVGNGATKLQDGNYIIRSNAWDNGAIVNAGAVTPASGNAPLKGEINPVNSVLGTATNSGFTQVFTYNYTHRQLIVGRPGSNIVSFFRVNKTPFDYDGDGKADLSVFRPSAASWYISHSSNNAFIATQFGAAGDLIAPADFDGDRKTDISVFRPSDGGWYRLNSANNTFSAFQFGAAGDLPVPGDFDGDGKADLTVYRPSLGSWYRINSSNNQFIAAQFGIAEDKPLVGDFDGDGKSDLTVYRPSNGTWYRINSGNDTFSPNQFGATGDLPVAADYDGDGKTDLAVYRPSVGDWYIINSSNSAFTATHFGVTEDKPAPADFDGDGKADLAVFRPTTGTWYLLRTTAGFTGFQFGANGDVPTPNAFVR